MEKLVLGIKAVVMIGYIIIILYFLHEYVKKYRLRRKFKCKTCGNDNLGDTIYISNHEGFRAVICRRCSCYSVDGWDYNTKTPMRNRFHKADKWSKKKLKEKENQEYGLSLNN